MEAWRQRAGGAAVAVVSAGTRSVTVSWTPPTQREDGSQLNGIGGYKIHWGPAADQLSNVDNVATGGSMDRDLTANNEVLWIGAGRDGDDRLAWPGGLGLHGWAAAHRRDRRTGG